MFNIDEDWLRLAAKSHSTEIGDLIQTRTPDTSDSTQTCIPETQDSFQTHTPATQNSKLKTLDLIKTVTHRLESRALPPALANQSLINSIFKIAMSLSVVF